MIMNLFVINLSTAIRQKKPTFRTRYNKHVIGILKELVKVQVVRNIKISGELQNQSLSVWLNLSNLTNNQVKVKNMSSFKKQKHLKIYELSRKLKYGNIFILATSIGYKNSFDCIRLNLGGTPILKICF